MPARFINVSNSGRAVFTNVNNSGRAIFGSGSAAPTTTIMANINIYAVQIAPTVAMDFHYSTDGGSTWNFVGVSIGTTCSNLTTITVPLNSNLSIRAGSNTVLSTVYSSNRAATATCPTWNSGTSACSWPLLTNQASRDYAFTVNQEQTIAC